MKNKAKKYAKYIGIVILAVILLRTDWRSLKQVVLKIDLGKLFLLYLVLIPKGMLMVYRWHRLLKKLSVSRSYWGNMKLYFSGFLLGGATPGKVGEFYRVVRLSAEGVPKGKGVFAVFLDRFFDISFVSILGVFGFYRLLYKTEFNSQIIESGFWVVLAVIAVIYSAIFIFKHKFTGLIVNFLKKLKFWEDKKMQVKEKVEEGLKNLNFSLFAEMASITLAFWLLHFLQLTLLGRLLGIVLPWPIMFMALAIVSIAAALPITVIGLGTREFAMIGVLGLLGVARENSLALSLMTYTFFLINIAFAALMWHLEHRAGKQN